MDLGAGRGAAVLAAGLMGCRSGGIELVGEYLQRARRVAVGLHLDVDLRHRDFLTAEWPQGDLYLVNSPAFPERFRNDLARVYGEGRFPADAPETQSNLPPRHLAVSLVETLAQEIRPTKHTVSVDLEKVDVYLPGAAS